MGVFDQPRIKLIIVYSKNTKAFANYLQGLIGSKDDEGDKIIGVKDGSVMTVVWSDAQYNDQKPTLSGDDRVVFIGKSKLINDENFGIESKYSKYGMSYGWLGTRAYLRVDKDLSGREMKDFIKVAKKYAPSEEEEKDFWIYFKEVTINMFLNNIPVIGLVKNVKEQIDYVENNRKLQYHTLTKMFYLEGLNKFLS